LRGMRLDLCCEDCLISVAKPLPSHMNFPTLFRSLNGATEFVHLFLSHPIYITTRNSRLYLQQQVHVYLSGRHARKC